jgi:hypothetical protein
MYPTKSNIIQAVNELTHTNFVKGPSLQRNASCNVISSKMLKNASGSQLRLQVPIAKREEREWTLEAIVKMED